METDDEHPYRYIVHNAYLNLSISFEIALNILSGKSVENFSTFKYNLHWIILW